MTRTVPVVAACVIAATLAAPASAATRAHTAPSTHATPYAHAAAVKVVKVQNFDFGPDPVRIGRGGTVEWRFLDRPSPHNVSSRGPLRFQSSSSKQTGTHRVRFRRAGTYRYICTIHPNMRARVIVR